MSSRSETFPPPRVTPNALHALGGVWRLAARRFFSPGYWLMLAGMIAVLVVLSIPAAPNQAEAARGFLPWAGGFYVCFLLPIFTFISAAGAIRDDHGAGTVDYILVRPVRRPAFVVFRYLAQVGSTQIDFLFALTAVIAIGAWHQVPGLWAAVPLLLLAQVTAIIVFSAFGLLCGTLTSRYVIVGLVYAGIVEVGLGNVPTQISQISLLRQVLGILRPILGDDEGPLTRAAHTAALGAPGIVMLLLGVSAALLAVTALMFSVREFVGTGSRET